jgi:putative membrane protein
MKKILLTGGLLCLAVFGLSGCPGGEVTNSNSGNRTMPGNNSNMSANTMNGNTSRENTNANMTSQSNSNAAADGDFMTKAAQGGMAEVALGNMASTKAANADVKAFGKKMIEDHTKANGELKAIATKKGVTLPTDVNAEQKATAERLSKLSGAEFDKEYVAVQVADHEKTVALFETEAKSGADAETKAFAEKTLPTLRMHLQMIKDMQGKMK